MKRKETDSSNAVMNRRISEHEFNFMDLDDEFDGYVEGDLEEYLEEEPAAKKKKTVKRTAEAPKKTVSPKKTASRKKSTNKKKAPHKTAASRKRRNNGKESRLWHRMRHMDSIDKVVAGTGAIIMVFAIVTCTLYADAKASDRQLSSFEEIGAQMDGIRVIGESGLLAMADAQAAKAVLLEEPEMETEFEEKELETKGAVEIVMHLSSMQKDLKIKFVNKETGKLVASIPFEVTITDSDKKTYTLKDEDADGVIYQTDMKPGKCSVAMEAVTETESYAISTENVEVTIKDKIEYKKVDVSDEVKKESEVNVAVEDTQKKDTTVESVLTDTVAWVESTKTAASGEGTGTAYEEVAKDKLTDLSALVKNGSVLKAAEGGKQTASFVSGNVVVYKVTLNASSAELLVGKTAKLTAKQEGTTDNSIVWASDNSGVAAVAADGTVTAVAEGTAVITAVNEKYASVKAECRVVVSKTPESDSTTKLTDKEGKQLYIKEGENSYREAVYSDYFKADKFYRAAENAVYRYTGWQTIDGKTYYFNAEGNKVTGEQIIQGAKYNFDSEGVLAASSGNMGIDVSKWNGSIDWNAVKNSGVSYVIIRCGYRGSTTGALIEDPKFRSNIQGATAAGLKVGVYFFTQAVNEVEAVEEASMVASLISGYKISYPVFLDVEPSGGRADNIGKDTRTAVCKAFCQTIQNSGYTAGIYANRTWFTSYINTGSLTGYKIWLAQYAAAPTYSATRYDLWQYSSKGSVAGISGSVDMNISYLGY